MWGTRLVGLSSRSAARVEDLLVTYSVTVSLLQAAEDNCRHNGQYPKCDERLVNAVDHFGWT